MSDRPHNAKPTLEELLRLKRAERPNADFWAGFERELRQKQLTALVEKRRWWHGLTTLTGRRLYLPVGATAVVAFALVAVRFQTPGRVAQIENTAPRIEANDPAVEMLPVTVVSAPRTSSRYEEPVVVESSRPATVAQVESIPAAPVREEISPSARSIAANLARLEQAEPELIQAVMGNRLTAARVQTAALNDEREIETAAAATPRYRLIARYAERALSPQPAAPVREHVARRLGDDLVDDVSRIGVGGNRVSLKF